MQRGEIEKLIVGRRGDLDQEKEAFSRFSASQIAMQQAAAAADGKMRGVPNREGLEANHEQMMK
ncbi:hypothetical protein MA16_Dca024235 [Dendrobium catenatum]|uniref:Uncharacterized protein n=1 Tax=Dendrobium catenatum TaxID=906689 RepID=A0A2I0VHB5_9ASPA|nr:hypothetical protein MA16_Dca024235 [Dendrobium catenatum]